MYKKDFYVNLPSNSCPLTHPDNEAGKFIVELKNSIHLDGDWEVALTDFTFVYKNFPFYNGSNIKYTKSLLHTSYEYLKYDEADNTYKITHDSQYYMLYIDGNILNINCSYFPFKITFNSIAEAKTMGFKEKEVQFNDEMNQIIIPPNNKIKFPTIQLTISYFYDVDYTSTFKENLFIHKFSQINNQIMNIFPKPFKSFVIEEGKVILIELADDVSKIQFSKFLANSLGLSEETYTDKIITGFRIPKIMQRNIQMMIYTNIIEPVLVGDVTVPLLKSVWVEKHKRDDLVQIIEKNPMYLPVSAEYINNIEINIRDDIGKYIFSKHDKTYLTLHFRKINE